MQSNWNRSFELVMKSEGGFTDNDKDPGNWLSDGRKGCTNLGVTQKAWEAFVGKQVTHEEMRALTHEDVKPFYKKEYWDAIKGDSLSSGVDYLMFDFCVNGGASRAIKLAQSAVGAEVDGHLGPITLSAINAMNPNVFIEKYSDAKEQFYKSLITFPTFGKGWLARLDRVENEAKDMING
jgi:lysozyme family protein